MLMIIKQTFVLLFCRACIPDSYEKGADAICYLVRELLLVELVGRTLKNVLREFQRRWMRSEQSTSDGVSCY
jgi:hypothetical protein